jgi:hypothetical protein
MNAFYNSERSKIAAKKVEGKQVDIVVLAQGSPNDSYVHTCRIPFSVCAEVIKKSKALRRPNRTIPFHGVNLSIGETEQCDWDDLSDEAMLMVERQPEKE